jgi:PRTRC genetic system ThiF family protein
MLIDQSLAAEAADYLLRLLTWQLKKSATYFEGGEARSNFILPEGVNTTSPAAPLRQALHNGPCIRPPAGSLHLVLVGCGGTGGWLVPALARLGRALNASGRETQITLVDHDRVEPGNILRQNFCEAEIGFHKAQSLVTRHAPVFRRSMSAVVVPFKAEMIREFSGDTLILIGCVDNAAARQELSRALELTAQPVWWIDSGNHAESGQVRIGSTASPQRLSQPFDVDGFCIELPAPSLQSPDLLVPWAEMNNLQPASCEQMALWNTQSLLVNQRAAVIVAQYVAALVGGTLNSYVTHFDLPTGTIRSQPITPAVLKGFC